MATATATPTVHVALSAAMADVQAIGKTSRNNEQGYNFRGVDAVVNVVGPVFRKHGIIPTPVQSEAHYRDVLTSRGKPSRECTVSVTYRFYGPGGDYIEAMVPGESMDFGDKGAAKAMSVAYRIALLQVLCIPTDDVEPDSQTYEREAAPPPPQWDPQEQAALVSTWTQTIGQAPDDKTLGEIAIRLRAMTQAGELSPASNDHLVKAWSARKGELNGGAA